MLNGKFSILYPMNMGQRIKSARESKKLSQEQLGKLVGVTKGAISQWEDGSTKNLKMAYLFGVEDATGYCARWLALGEGSEKVGDSLQPFSAEEFKAEAESMSNQELSALLEIVARRLSQ